MDIIRLKNMQFYGFHGVSESEKHLGGRFEVDLEMQLPLKKSCDSDNLNDTVDYVKIIAIVKEQMAIRSDMIEHPAKRIVDAILLLDKVQKVKVEVEKITPPIDAAFDKISVTVKGEQN